MLRSPLRRYQFRMKHLLLLTMALCLFLGWWFQPFTIEESMVDGAVTVRYRVRRSWNGTRHHYGPIRLFYKNGTMGAESSLFGVKVGDVDLVTGGVSTQYWKDDGTSASFEEWSEFMSLEYFPTQMIGESLRDPRAGHLPTSNKLTPTPTPTDNP